MGKIMSTNANLYTGDARRLSAQTIFGSILEKKMTFSEMAPEYGLTEDQLAALIREKVGPKEFSRLKTASRRNASLKEKMQRKATPRRNSETSSQEKEGILLLDARMLEVSKLQNKLQEAEVQIEAVTSTIEAKKQLAEIEQKKLDEANQMVSQAEKNLQDAKSRQGVAKKSFDEASQKLGSSKEELARWKEKKTEIEKQLKEIENSCIYLVAPDFQGELPSFGTCISAVPKDGTTLEDATDVELIEEMTAEDIFLFDSMSEAKAAFKFVKLVVKYWSENKEYQILVESDSIKKLLKKQGLLDD